eukprot:705820-Prorocentrum_minimum.AAC.1
MSASCARGPTEKAHVTSPARRRPRGRRSPQAPKAARHRRHRPEEGAFAGEPRQQDQLPRGGGARQVAERRPGATERARRERQRLPRPPKRCRRGQLPQQPADLPGGAEV